MRSLRGETILHTCARYSNRAIMDVLTTVGISNVDLEAIVSYGMTAAECFAARQVKTVEVEDAMRSLLASVKTQISSSEHTEHL